MTDLNEWLLEKAAAGKKLHPELAANAAKVREAQDPNKPGAEKPDLYAPGKGKGKGGRMIPKRKELEGPARTKTEKIAGTVFDTADQEFMIWLEEKGDLGLQKEGAAEGTPVSDGKGKTVAKTLAAAVPATVAATVGAQKALKMMKEKKEKKEKGEEKETEKEAYVGPENLLGAGLGYVAGKSQKERGEKHRFGGKQVASLLIPGGAGYQAGRFVAHARGGKKKDEGQKKEAKSYEELSREERKDLSRSANKEMSGGRKFIGIPLAKPEVVQGRRKAMHEETMKVKPKYQRTGRRIGGAAGAILGAGSMIRGSKGMKPLHRAGAAAAGAAGGGLLGAGFGHIEGGNQARNVGTMKGLMRHDRAYLESRGYKLDEKGRVIGRKKTAAQAGAGGTSGGLLRGIKRMSTAGGNIAAMTNPVTGPAMAAKKIMGKAAAFTPSAENEALLRKILNKVQAESSDAG